MHPLVRSIESCVVVFGKRIFNVMFKFITQAPRLAPPLEMPVTGRSREQRRMVALEPGAGLVGAAAGVVQNLILVVGVPLGKGAVVECGFLQSTDCPPGPAEALVWVPVLLVLVDEPAAKPPVGDPAGMVLEAPPANEVCPRAALVTRPEATSYVALESELADWSLTLAL